MLGAAGKMGSGIVLLVAMEMADIGLRPENRSRRYVLHAIDVSHEALGGLIKVLREQVLKTAVPERGAAGRDLGTTRGCF